MKKIEKARQELEAAVVESRRELESRRAVLWEAEKVLANTTGIVDVLGGFTARRDVQVAQKALVAARAAMEEATRKHEEAEGALIGYMASAEDVKKGDYKVWVVSASSEAARSFGVVQRLQKELLAEARRLIALRAVARKKAPRRVISRRSSNFVRVEVLDPAIRALYETADPPWTFRVEFFRAVRGEREGKWRILPGQSLDPGTVEILWGDVGLPPELDAIGDLDIGYLFRPNGTGGKLKSEKLDATNIERFLEEAELERAAQTAERVTS